MDKLIVWHRLAFRGTQDAGAPGAIAAWSRRVRARVLASGGEVLAHVSGTVVAQFDPSDAVDVVELALGLVEEAEESGRAVAIGMAAGEVEGGAGRPVEIAELLAARAQLGEIVLDASARAHTEGLFLFARQVSTGPGGPRGAAIDREHPRRDACAEGIARLQLAPIAPITAQCVGDLLETVQERRPPVLVLRAPDGAGADELVVEAAAVARPRMLLAIGSAPGGVVPLASLRRGLERAFPGVDAIASACGDDGEGRRAAAVLGVVLRGGLPLLTEIAPALARFLATAGASRSPRPAWVFLSPLAMVDAATLDVLLAAREAGAPVVLLARDLVDARLPSVLEGCAREFTLPPLRTSDARAIAEAVLGPGTDPEIARRIAVLGGETPLGVVEVARALVASGDLVFDGESFKWRSSPRGGVTARSLEGVVNERLERLDDEARRVLDALCVAPEGARRELVDAVAARDGVTPRGRVRAWTRLAREAWLGSAGPWPPLPILDAAGALRGDRPHPSSAFVRRCVMQAMPPSRLAELHRFTAEALLAEGADDPARPSLHAELGWYEIEGGLVEAGAARIGEVARFVIGCGYRRAGSRLARLLMSVRTTDVGSTAPAALESIGDKGPGPASSEMSLTSLLASESQRRGRPRQRALDTEEVAYDVKTPTERPAEPAPPPPFAAAAEEAVRRRDPAALEQVLQRAIANGSEMAAVARFRAMVDLLQGNVGAARRALAKARRHRKDEDGGPHQALAEAAVALRGGDPAGAIRCALRALAAVRRKGDRKGEIASLCVLAACYRALGRDSDAARFESAGTAG
jgi:hypothetical protein